MRAIEHTSAERRAFRLNALLVVLLLASPSAAARVTGPEGVLEMDGKYTVHLVSAPEAIEIDRYLDRFRVRLADPVARFRYRDKNAVVWHGLVSGSFGKYSDAKRFIDRLPAAARAGDPFVRFVAKVQRDVRVFGGPTTPTPTVAERPPVSSPAPAVAPSAPDPEPSSEEREEQGGVLDARRERLARIETDLDQRSRTLDTENERLQRKQRSLAAALLDQGNERRKLDDERVALEALRSALEREREALASEQAAAADEETGAARLEAERAELDELRREIGRDRERLGSLREQAEAQKEVALLQQAARQEIDQQQSDLDRQRQKLTRLEGQLEETQAKLEAQLRDQAEIDRAKGDILKQRAALEERERSLVEQRRQHTRRVKRETEELARTAESIARERTDLERDRGAFEAEIASGRADLNNEREALEKNRREQESEYRERLARMEKQRPEPSGAVAGNGALAIADSTLIAVSPETPPPPTSITAPKPARAEAVAQPRPAPTREPTSIAARMESTIEPLVPEPRPTPNKAVATRVNRPIDELKFSDWVERQGDFYTIQLASMTEGGRMWNFYLDNAADLETPVALYRYHAKGVNWNTLISGRYESRREAERRLEALPSRLKFAEPRVRSMSDIQSDVREYRKMMGY